MRRFPDTMHSARSIWTLKRPGFSNEQNRARWRTDALTKDWTDTGLVANIANLLIGTLLFKQADVTVSPQLQPKGVEMRSINPGLLLFALFVNLFAIRLGSLFLPDKMYFSFSSFLFDTRDLDKPLAIAFKMLVPFLAAFVMMLGLIWIARLQERTLGPGWITAVVADQAVLTLGSAAFASVLLMAWPYILLWDMLVAPELGSQRLTFLVAYVSYFVATGLFAVAGANTASAVTAPRAEPRAPLTLAVLAESPFVQPLLNSLGGTFSAAIATLIALQGG